MGTLSNFAVFVIFSFVANIFAQVPHIDPRDFPMPGRILSPGASGDDVVTSHTYKYTPAGYEINTKWYGGKRHIANGTLQSVDDEYFYVEEGFYIDALPERRFEKVDYKIDKDGFEELQRNEISIVTPRVSAKAIRGILG